MSHLTMKGRTVLLFSLIAVYFCGSVAQTTDCKNVTMADIVFLVDGSSSIPPHGFEDIKRFLRTFIESVDIGRNKVRVGLAQYSDEPFQEFQLKDHMDKRSLLAALEGLSQRQGGTETGKAITFLHNEYFTKEAGSRASEQVPQIAVVITDGKSSDDVTKPAQRLRKEKGVIVFGIGVGQADEEELKSVASRPPHRFLLTIDSFGALQHATEDLLKTVCVSMVDKRQDLVDRISDIFFLVDSGISQQQFNLFRTELNKLINQLNIGASNNRIGLAQYGQNIRVEFLLNAHQTKQETQASVKRFRLRPPQPNEPRNLGGALKYARTNFFNSDAGGRAEQGFRQFMVVVSGQASSDSVSTEVHSIRKSGVTIVGMSAGAPMDSVRLLSDQDVFDSPRVTLLKDLFITEKEDNITEECKVVNKVDIVFIVDESGSIGQANFGLVRYFLHSIVSSLDVSQTTVRVGIVTYNDNPTAQAYLDTFNDKNDTRQFIKILPYTGGGTNTGKALDFTRNEIFNEKKGSRKDVQKVAVVITDGESQDDVSEAAVHLRRKGITVFAVGIKDASISQLEQIASYPPNKHVFPVDSFTELKPMKTILQKILCNNINEQAVIDNKRTSDAKDACVPKDEADFFFLIDVSGSIDSTGLTEMKRFIIEFLHTFRVGPRHVRIGLMKYSDSPILEFDLTVYANAKDVEKAVMAIEKVGLNTYTGKALSEMEPYFKRAKSSRPKVPKYLIVITDGKATDQVMEPAKTLRDHDVNIYAIGVKGAVKAELVEIAGDNKRTFSVNDFDSLKNLHKQLITDICIPDVCKNVSGDVIFLVDGSESISEEDFQKIKDFVKSIISKTTISEDGVHVGIMQYSTEYKLEFSLNEHYNIDEMFRDIDIMQQISQGTSTGEAISAVSEYFNINNGGRPELQQKLVVLTDGKSKDDVSYPAAALREKGVTIYAIGVADANAVELEIISGSKQRVYFDKDFDALKSWESQVVVELCKADCKKTRNADVIFLVDGSANKNLNMFKSIHRFMETIVDLTEVGKDWARFGVILYADNAESVFTLDKYKNKRDVIEAIHAIKPLRGNTNTAKAMEYSLEYFNDTHGGRPTKNIHQILMVITDRDASDHYHLERASKALKENRVIVFSIGVEPANRDQLKIMADGDESRVFYANNYDALEILRKTVSPVWCKFTPEVCETEKADLVFLLDSSSSITLDDHAIMLNFTSELVSRFKVGQDFVRVGAAQFSDLQYHEFYLKDYYNKEDVIAHIHKMVYHGRNTYIGRALKYIKDYFTVAQGSRKSGVPRSLVLISDGDDNDNEFDILEDEANDLRAMGVRIFAIGVGDVHLLQLLQIAGKPSRVFNVRTFKGLAEIKNEVLDRVCEPDLIPITPECSIDIAIGFDISKRTGLPGEMLVSGHHNLRKNLPQIMHYISSVSSLCCLNGTKINTSIAFQVVDSNGRSLYDTNFEEYSKDVLQKVMTLPMTQPTYFNTALLNSFQNKFATSRAGVKVLVIFSDGLDEDLNNLLHVREQLRNSEVNALLTVALEGAQNPAELQRLEFGRGFHYEERLSITMRDVGSAILKQIDSVSDRECCNVTCKCVGNDGPRGPWGPPGPKGGPGRKGQPGFAGDEGTSGARGPPGPAGPPGIQGCPGVRGQKGSRSTRGERGEKGDDGLDGLDGEQGVPGLNGSRGERGDLGNPGIPGIPGEGGLKGERGLRGDPGQPGVDNTQPGPKGEPGNPGLLGKHGPDGRKGDDGDIGNQGPDGRRGGSGRKGGPGQPAETGLPGIQGAPGLQGGRGNPGDRGPKGISGFPGPAGKHGRPGGKGQVGHRGPNGQKGQPGNPGIKGNPGSQGPRGMPGQDGRDGRGPAGPTGSKGDPGFPGYPGLQGEEGQKGTKGHPGHKGNSGRPGNTGRPGEGGGKGDKGGPGHNGRKGPPGEGISQCDLINYIRENCVCCDDPKKACPAYPTELVFGLDMTVEDTFQRQRNALLSLLEDISIAESNCPTGTRVAVVGYNSVTKYLIRFQDYRRKAQLIEAVKNIRLETTTNERSLGAAMHFVGRNVFKHIRAGALMRKVAVFFTNGPSRDKNEIVTAVMEYRGLNIIPAVISLGNAPNVREAMEVDDTGHSVFTVLGRPQDQAADLRKVKNCVICYDPCRHEEECSFIQEPVRPQEVGLDLVMVADSSRLMQADEYAGTQQLLSSVVEQLVVSPQPRRADGKVRIAVVQSGIWTPKLEFGLQTYQDQQRMKRHLMKDMQQQGGSSALGLTLSYTLREVFLKASQPRRRKAILTVVGTQTAYEDRARLQYISQKAKCEGVAMFVVTVGDRYDRTQVEELASLPVQQHLIHVGRLRADERGYAQRFFRVFLSALNKGMNSYPPDSVKRTCHQLQEPTPGPLAPALDLNGLGSAELMDEGTEEQEQIGVKATQLDIIETLNTENGQSLLSVANITDARCLLRKDAGNCEKYTEKWFFDSDVGQCSHFWYSGCGGNSNRFETQKACEKLCLRKSH